MRFWGDRIVGVGVPDDPTAVRRQFGIGSEKCCAFSGGTSRPPSPTGGSLKSAVMRFSGKQDQQRNRMMLTIVIRKPTTTKSMPIAFVHPR